MTEIDPERSYRCPYCDAEYPTEMLARVHVSYVDDSTHEGRDGMTPEVEPVELDGDGERVGTAFTLAGRLNLHGLSLADVPAVYDGREFDERERRALLVAAFNADRTVPDTELQDRVAAHLDEHGFDPLPARELGELCRHVYHPQADSGDEPERAGITTAETTLRDLTPLQQAILLAHLARPDSDPAAVARQVGTARSYPAQVVETRETLVERLRSRIDAGATVERIVAERVPAAALEEIREEGYLDGVDIDLAAASERKRRRSGLTGPAETPAESPTRATAGETSTAQRDTSVDDESPGDPPDDATVDRDPDRGRVEQEVDEARGDPDDGAAVDPDTGRPSLDGTDRRRPGTDRATGWRTVDERSSGAGERGDGETVPRAEVEAVREQVAFDLAVVEQEMELADPTPQQVRTKAYLQQILDRLDEILS